MLSLTLELTKNKPLHKNTDCLKPFASDEVKKVRAFHNSMWGYYHETPLLELKALAAWFGVKSIFVKDEAPRFGLKSFKALGGSFAIASYLSQKSGRPLSFDELTYEKLQDKVYNITFATTTDGNHGRGVAWIARLLGFPAVVYMPKGSVQARVDAIKHEGATVKVTDLNYDDTVRLLAEDANTNGWVIIQDTAWPHYEQIPLWIMQGYSTMAAEALDKIPLIPTHIFAQAGVGSMAAAVQAVVANRGYGKKPVFTILEAATANCFYRSFKEGKPCNVEGDLSTIMAGLACGEVNPLAWEIIKNYSSFALSCHDEVTALGMRILGNPLGSDPKITAGESGAIGAGVIGLLDKYHNLKTDMGINKDSVLLIFNTEGDTFPENYRDIVWGGSNPCDFRGDF
ncbi:MAG: diaminopropionate ammonia-lyase [Acidaminococcaceae bacterium]|nr:diaminopropionate ammonia-lyase [Acidaminococcaceae bacterium]MDD4722225.1 diaminopropionate ammonia-lyase [Acidaminococcaceae bacterium]